MLGCLGQGSCLLPCRSPSFNSLGGVSPLNKAFAGVSSAVVVAPVTQGKGWQQKRGRDSLSSSREPLVTSEPPNRGQPLQKATAISPG